MEDNAIRIAIETREDKNGDAPEMQDNRDDRQYQRWRQRLTSTVVDMRENRDG